MQILKATTWPAHPGAQILRDHLRHDILIYFFHLHNYILTEGNLKIYNTRREKHPGDKNKP